MHEARIVELSRTQMVFVAMLASSALIMAVYLYLQAHAFPAGDVPDLPVLLLPEEGEYRGYFVVNPNSSPRDSLELLPGIGPVLAQRIVDYRADHVFAAPEDLLKVAGLGQQTLGRIKPYLVFTAP